MTSRKLQLAVVEPDPDDPLGAWRSILIALEKDIRHFDVKSLEARHSSGAHMLKLRDGVRLPMRVRQALIEDLGISKTEIANRMNLAKKYQVTDLSNLLDKFPTWYDVCRDALYEKRPAEHKPVQKTTRNMVPLSRTAGDFAKRLATVERLRPVDIRALRALAQTINSILAAQEAAHS